MPASAPGKGEVMSAKTRTPYTRLIALAALIVAAGVLSMRVYDAFGSAQADPVGSSVERELTYLLEPIAGANKVRVSISGRTDRTVLVMIDGAVATDLRASRDQIESVLIAALGFDAETDTLTLTQFPFARGVGGSLTPIQITEIASLGLLCCLLLVALLGTITAPVSTPVADATVPKPRELLFPPPTRMTAAEPEPDTDLAEAGQLAQSKPDDTARLVRGWMSYAEE